MLTPSPSGLEIKLSGLLHHSGCKLGKPWYFPSPVEIYIPSNQGSRVHQGQCGQPLEALLLKFLQTVSLCIKQWLHTHVIIFIFTEGYCGTKPTVVQQQSRWRACVQCILLHSICCSNALCLLWAVSYEANGGESCKNCLRWHFQTWNIHSILTGMESLKPPHLCRGNTWFICSYIIHIHSLLNSTACQRQFYSGRERVSQANWWCQILLNQQNFVLCSGLKLTSFLFAVLYHTITHTRRTSLKNKWAKGRVT